jgi:hypothetical protein
LACGSLRYTLSLAVDRPGDSETNDLERCDACGSYSYLTLSVYDPATQTLVQATADNRPPVD